MQPPMDSHMTMGPRMNQGKPPPPGTSINGAMLPPPMHPPHSQMAGQPSGPFGDPTQLSSQMASMQINHPGTMPRYPGPPVSHPSGIMPGMPGPSNQPSLGGYQPATNASMVPGLPAISASSNGGISHGNQMLYNTNHMPPSVSSESSPIHSMGPPPPMARGSSPPYMPPTQNTNRGPVPPSSMSMPPPMPSNSMGMHGAPIRPMTSNQMGMPSSNIMQPPMPPPNPMGMSGSHMPPPNSFGTTANSMPPMPGSTMQPPVYSNPTGNFSHPSTGPSSIPPIMSPYSAANAMPPHSNAAPQHTTGGPMPPSMSQRMPNSAGPPMMPPTPNAPYGNAGGVSNAYGGSGSAGMAPQSQSRRLDPDHMPSVIQVITNDRQQRSGVFSTAQRGVNPPLVTTDFVVQDHGYASPRFIRSTLYNVPGNADLLKQMAVPFVLNITPFAKLHDKENPVPISDMGPQGPVRCNRCKAYMSGFMTFIDGGRRFQCALCGGCSDVPVEYFAHLDHTGRRVDCGSRPELWAGSYELMATQEYCKGNKLPESPAFIFMLDVSYNSVKSGLTELFCQRLKTEILPKLPREVFPDGTQSEPRVGFATYDKNVHFYNLKPCLSQPQMQVVSDMEDVFVPLVDGFLVSPSEADTLVDLLMEFIPKQFGETRQTETVLGPAIQAGMEALKAANCNGKLFMFHTSLPIAEAPGKLKNRDDRKLLGTEKEKTILSPSTQYYTKLGEECVAAGCSVDLFVFPNAYIDLATISEVSRLTGGNIYKYTYFQADLHADQFISDLSQAVSMPVAFDAVMRVRTSAGTRPVDFYGNLYMSNTTDVECAAFDSNKSVSVEIKHDDKLNDGDLVYVQAAILYTSLGGQRRLRIHNLALNVSNSLIELFRAAELDTLVNFMLKHSLRMTLNKSPKDVRESIANQCAAILTCYRKNCAQTSNIGQLILPEGMKLLPLYCNCVIKNDALQGGSEISTDDRSFLMFIVGSLNVVESQNFLYPRILPLHSLDTDSNALPQAVRASIERLQADGVYLLDNGFHMFLWIGQNVNLEFLQSVFGVQTAAQIDVENPQLLELDNPISERVHEIVSMIRAERGRHLRLTFVRQHDKLEHWFKHFMVEDRGENGSTSYVDFLCHIHKEIRTLLS